MKKEIKKSLAQIEYSLRKNPNYVGFVQVYEDGNVLSIIKKEDDFRNLVVYKTSSFFEGSYKYSGPFKLGEINKLNIDNITTNVEKML